MKSMTIYAATSDDNLNLVSWQFSVIGHMGWMSGPSKILNSLLIDNFAMAQAELIAYQFHRVMGLHDVVNGDGVRHEDVGQFKAAHLTGTLTEHARQQVDVGKRWGW